MGYTVVATSTDVAAVTSRCNLIVTTVRFFCLSLVRASPLV